MKYILTSFQRYITFVTPLFFFELFLLFLLIDFFHFSPVMSVLIAFIIVGFIGFFIEWKIIFHKNTQNFQQGFFLYSLIIISGGIIAAFLMSLLVKLFNSYFVDRLIIAFFAGMWDFLWNFFINFKK